MFVKKVHIAGMGAHFYPCIGVSDGRVPVQFLEHIADLQARLIPATLKTVERHHHLLGELPESKLILLPIQDPLAPSLDEGGILNLFPPVWHLPNAIRESAHLHFDDLTIAQLSCQPKSLSDKENPHCSWVLLALLRGIVLALMKWMYVVAVLERVVNTGSWPGYCECNEVDEKRSSTGSRTHITGYHFRRS